MIYWFTYFNYLNAREVFISVNIMQCEMVPKGPSIVCIYIYAYIHSVWAPSPCVSFHKTFDRNRLLTLLCHKPKPAGLQRTGRAHVNQQAERLMCLWRPPFIEHVTARWVTLTSCGSVHHGFNSHGPPHVTCQVSPMFASPRAPRPRPPSTPSDGSIAAVGRLKAAGVAWCPSIRWVLRDFKHRCGCTEGSPHTS